MIREDLRNGSSLLDDPRDVSRIRWVEIRNRGAAGGDVILELEGSHQHVFHCDASLLCALALLARDARHFRHADHAITSGSGFRQVSRSRNLGLRTAIEGSWSLYLPRYGRWILNLLLADGKTAWLEYTVPAQFASAIATLETSRQPWFVAGDDIIVT